MKNDFKLGDLVIVADELGYIKEIHKFGLKTQPPHYLVKFKNNLPFDSIWVSKCHMRKIYDDLPEISNMEEWYEE